eukprot:GHVP01009817.1.p1 GENE.GHVP01009817.1~~GHVP01009817.1.p1  ORF type:complete len:282 (+),score=47.87 GHVP01009817.1:164-1009(+)
MRGSAAPLQAPANRPQNGDYSSAAGSQHHGYPYASTSIDESDESDVSTFWWNTLCSKKLTFRSVYEDDKDGRPFILLSDEDGNEIKIKADPPKSWESLLTFYFGEGKGNYEFSYRHLFSLRQKCSNDMVNLILDGYLSAFSEENNPQQGSFQTKLIDDTTICVYPTKFGYESDKDEDFFKNLAPEKLVFVHYKLDDVDSIKLLIKQLHFAVKEEMGLVECYDERWRKTKYTIPGYEIVCYTKSQRPFTTRVYARHVETQVFKNITDPKDTREWLDKVSKAL